ncbi:MAG: hypothetical protein IT508_08695 [Burkholderiaceae bacterium]|nr:hypothetical protein [Burkholderiaceae bacterium]
MKQIHRAAVAGTLAAILPLATFTPALYAQDHQFEPKIPRWAPPAQWLIDRGVTMVELI